ncbi:MAG: hypothetical protein FWH41_06570 [Treponema sp.]|nr:hypothetical protein [Treponema sp.]
MRLSLKKRPLFVILIHIIVVSCVSSVKFEVKHLPLVDLRNVYSITVIPFEWSAIPERQYLSMQVTDALINGLKKGRLDFADPYALQDIYSFNYRKYADVYITGRILSAYSYRHRETIETIDIHSNEPIKENYITRTSTVEIEYAYYRSNDNKELGSFKKIANAYDYIKYTIHPRYNTNRNTGRYTNYPSSDRRQAGGRRGNRRVPIDSFPYRESWEEKLSETAITNFSNSMADEISPWTTEEKRIIKKAAKDDPLAKKARKFIALNQYEQALELYQKLYTQNKNIFYGYNAAILAANRQYSASHVLLEKICNELIMSGNRVPAFVEKEMRKMAEFADENKILQEYYAEKPAMAINGIRRAAILVEDDPWPVSNSITGSGVRDNGIISNGGLTGTVNLYPASVFALSAAISSNDDDSIFAKIVASDYTHNGQWSIRLPDTAPKTLWFLVTDGYQNSYITKTALVINDLVINDLIIKDMSMNDLGISGMITLDINAMENLPETVP